MSGFEIAGVVLGAIPLLISGLEQYRKGLETISSMRHYEETIENLLITFETTRARYLFTCETLLAPLLLPQNQYLDLINAPTASRAWNDAQLQDDLKDRLGIACGSYVGLIQRLYKALMKFAGKMEIEIQQSMKTRLPAPASQAKISTQSWLQTSRIWSRIRVGLESGGLERLLDGMEKDVFRLERLLETSANLPAIRRDRKRKLSKRPWQVVRNSAQSLFATFVDQWHCACTSSHAAMLKLDVLDTSKKDHATVQFDVLLSKSAIDPSISFEQMTWHNIQVRSVEDTNPPTTPAAAGPSQGKGQSKISFVISSIDDLALAKTSNPQKIQAIGSKIDNLSSLLRQQTPGSTLGYLDGQEWKHTLALPLQASLPPTQPQIVRIRDLLDPQLPTNLMRPSSLSTRQRYHLALLMAFTVLQLFETSWLSSYESLHDVHIVLPQTPSSSTYPFAMKSFDPHLPTTSQIHHQMQRIGVQNELLFQLGVLLLEIAYGAPISKLRLPSDLDASGSETILTDYLVAVRLADDITQREPSKYSDAVRRCLFCRFTCTSTNLSDLELQEEFHDGVVAPLLELYSVFS